MNDRMNEWMPECVCVCVVFEIVENKWKHFGVKCELRWEWARDENSLSVIYHVVCCRQKHPNVYVCMGCEWHIYYTYIWCVWHLSQRKRRDNDKNLNRYAVIFWIISNTILNDDLLQKFVKLLIYWVNWKRKWKMIYFINISMLYWWYCCCCCVVRFAILLISLLLASLNIMWIEIVSSRFRNNSICPARRDDEVKEANRNEKRASGMNERPNERAKKKNPNWVKYMMPVFQILPLLRID